MSTDHICLVKQSSRSLPKQAALQPWWWVAAERCLAENPPPPWAAKERQLLLAGTLPGLALASAMGQHVSTGGGGRERAPPAGQAPLRSSALFRPGVKGRQAGLCHADGDWTILTAIQVAARGLRRSRAPAPQLLWEPCPRVGGGGVLNREAVPEGKVGLGRERGRGGEGVLPCKPFLQLPPVSEMLEEGLKLPPCSARAPHSISGPN